MKFIALALGLWCVHLAGAQPLPPGSGATAPVADTSSRVEILRASRYNFEKKDSATELISLAGAVCLRQNGTLFFADSAVVNQATKLLEAFGNVRINDGDSLNTYANYLRYAGADKKAYLKGNVKLVDNKGGVLTTQELWYDLNTGIANYKTGGKVLNKKTVLTSTGADYYDGTKDVVFRRKVELRAPDYTIFTDSLQYNSQTEVATFIAPTTVLNGTRKIFTRQGYYDLRAGKAVFGERPRIVDSSYNITANDMRFDDSAGVAQFMGNVVYNDTANGVSILSNQLFANNKKSAVLATEKPLMIIRQRGDSLYVAADSLYSGKITDMPARRTIPVITDTAAPGWKAPDLRGKDSSMNRFFEAWYNVRIFSDSVQAKADSLFYGGIDSAFRLFKNPVLWSNDSQITGDTIYLFTSNQKPARLVAFFNSFIVNKVGANEYNQVKGNTVNALFNDGNLDYARAKGRAETVYYAQDASNLFVGMNRATSDAVDLFFADRKPQRVKFINDLKGVTYPMRQIPGGEAELKGFSWLDALRPKTWLDLLSP
jgi:lipopolysaccharide export system protein LptA